MRGKEKFANTPDHCFRITPAYAGKSFTLSAEDMAERDHPRLCGEKYFRRWSAILRKGSPPPMRGKGWNCIVRLLLRRITPAYAGKRGYYKCLEVTYKDHPRLCGEKQIFRMDTFGLKGSPPPMRGKDTHDSLGSMILGITPAYAGKRVLCSKKANCS